MRSWLKAFLLALSAAATLGCSSESCPDIGCRPGLVLLRVQANWPPGAYEIAATSASGTDKCAFSIDGEVSAVTCTDGALLISDRLAVDSSIRMRMDHTPKQVSVVVTRDGATLQQVDLTPNYTDARPAECHSQCLQAEAAIGE